ncbi:hypothetical protein [Vibrio splendidus]|uniref:Uncharacterized protein n=1 Tax=Vibrio splendidus TaxID=29497 RepID=A0A2N7JQN8_VIBSP|nr:hypothetical protein [Vibrio splendidus]PMM52253.1 hypothetical protein BCT54_23350 [Vibrio splendidus]
MRHQSLSTLCLMEASGQFLTDFFPVEVLSSRRDKLAWIQEHKWEVVENEPDECVLNFIESLATRLQTFVQTQLTTQQTLAYTEEVEALLLRRYNIGLQGIGFESESIDLDETPEMYVDRIALKYDLFDIR